MGDEIDEELNNARKRLHEDISLRIKYFEEKEKEKGLSEREKQELEDLKRPGKLDEEELFVEEYVINEIYEGLTEKEKEDKDKIEDIKGKGKEMKVFDFTAIYLEDLNLERLFEENFEIFEMALNIAKCRKYDGSENPEDWVKEFERVARANAWVDADHANNSLSYNFAIAHLEGEAADWFEENRVTFTRWNMGDNHAARLR